MLFGEYKNQGEISQPQLVSSCLTVAEIIFRDSDGQMLYWHPTDMHGCQFADDIFKCILINETFLFWF